MEWIISCNLKYYDVDGAFANLKTIDWKQSNKNIAVGDTVYIYVGASIRAIKYKCRVNKTNIDHCEIDDSKYIKIGDVYTNYGNYMEVEFLQKYPDKYLSIDTMYELCVKGNIQSPRKMSPLLSEMLNCKGLMPSLSAKTQ